MSKWKLGFRTLSSSWSLRSLRTVWSFCFHRNSTMRHEKCQEAIAPTFALFVYRRYALSSKACWLLLLTNNISHGIYVSVVVRWRYGITLPPLPKVGRYHRTRATTRLFQLHAMLKHAVRFSSPDREERIIDWRAFFKWGSRKCLIEVERAQNAGGEHCLRSPWISPLRSRQFDEYRDLWQRGYNAPEILPEVHQQVENVTRYKQLRGSGVRRTDEAIKE